MTNEVKHTPGPWEARELPYGPNTQWSVGRAEIGPEHTLAKILRPQQTRQVAEANAFLIAAAPAMLEALELAVSYGWEHESALAAIRLAKGGV